MKGSSSNLGARRLASICLNIERLAKAGQLADAQELYPELTAEFGRVCAILEIEKQR